MPVAVLVPNVIHNNPQTDRHTDEKVDKKAPQTFILIKSIHSDIQFKANKKDDSTGV